MTQEQYEAMVAEGQRADVTEALADLAVMMAAERAVDWQAVAATLSAIAPIAMRLARPLSDSVGTMAATRLAA